MIAARDREAIRRTRRDGRSDGWHGPCSRSAVRFGLVYGVLLALAALISERSARTVLSTAVLFLVAGLAIGRSGLDLLALETTDPTVEHLAELALFTLLYVEGCKLSLVDLKGAWKLPTRAILLGMPATIVGLTLAAHFLIGLAWLPAVLLAAILSPTDPVFAAAILRFDSVPLRVRRLLGIESGVNDGLALPLIMVLFALLGHAQPQPGQLMLEVLGGVLLGVFVPAAFRLLERSPLFDVSRDYRALLGIGLAIVIFASAKLMNVNEYLAAYTGGVSLASFGKTHAAATSELGETLAEGLKLAAVLTFAVVLTIEDFSSLSAGGWVFVAIALLIVRPIALVVALLTHSLTTREWLAAAWFGPKGFASIVYASMMVQRQIPHADEIFQIVAVVTAVSIVAHSSTDLIVVAKFQRQSE